MKVKHYEFTVQGWGSFPLDQLRYDTCYPVRSADVDALSLQRDTCTPEEWTKPRKVVLRSEHKPSAARWASFGWHVLDSVPLY